MSELPKVTLATADPEKVSEIYNALAAATNEKISGKFSHADLMMGVVHFCVATCNQLEKSFLRNGEEPMLVREAFVATVIDALGMEDKLAEVVRNVQAHRRYRRGDRTGNRPGLPSEN